MCPNDPLLNQRSAFAMQSARRVSPPPQLRLPPQMLISPRAALPKSCWAKLRELSHARGWTSPYWKVSAIDRDGSLVQIPVGCTMFNVSQLYGARSISAPAAQISGVPRELLDGCWRDVVDFAKQKSLQNAFEKHKYSANLWIKSQLVPDTITTTSPPHFIMWERQFRILNAEELPQQSPVLDPVHYFAHTGDPIVTSRTSEEALTDGMRRFASQSSAWATVEMAASLQLRPKHKDFWTTRIVCRRSLLVRRLHLGVEQDMALLQAFPPPPLSAVEVATFDEFSSMWEIVALPYARKGPSGSEIDGHFVTIDALSTTFSDDQGTRSETHSAATDLVLINGFQSHDLLNVDQLMPMDSPI